MEKLSETNNRIRISQDFFCDGHCYLLTSSSLGGSGITATELSETMFNGDEEKITGLLKKGAVFPVCFPGDCALDGDTLFVLGDLNEKEEHDWIARIAWKLNIPCGKLIICCGCLDEDLEPAISGEPPDENYTIYQVIEVPPAEYLVEIYAYFSSMTVQVSLNKYDDKGNCYEDEESADWYRENRPGIEGVNNIIRLSPLKTEPPMPKLNEGWFDEFEFRGRN